MDGHSNGDTCNLAEDLENELFSNKKSDNTLPETNDEAEVSQTPPFFCAACGECFTDYEQLTLHHCAQLHKKIFSCDTCGKTFQSRGTLYAHVQVHLNKPLICEICDKSFSKQTHLTVHMRTHTGMKPYSCDHCNRSFTQRGSLVRHMIVHSEKRPFTCRSCYKHFSDRNIYILHLQAHVLK